MNHQTAGLVFRTGDAEKEGIRRRRGANGLIGLSCEQSKSNMQIALALSSGPNRVHSLAPRLFSPSASCCFVWIGHFTEWREVCQVCYCLSRLAGCVWVFCLWGHWMMIHLKTIVLTEICQFPFYEGADGREMRMDIHRESSLCHTCTLGRARSTRLLVGDPSWHRDRSDVPLAKHKRPDQRAITILCADDTTGDDMIMWTGGYYFPPVRC